MTTPDDRPDGDASAQPVIPSWVRVATILTVLPVWVGGVLFSMLVLHELPDAAWTVIPSAIIAVAAPSWRWPTRGTTPGGDGQ